MKKLNYDENSKSVIPDDTPDGFFNILSSLLSFIEEADSKKNPEDDINL